MGEEERENRSLLGISRGGFFFLNSGLQAGVSSAQCSVQVPGTDMGYRSTGKNEVPSEREEPVPGWVGIWPTPHGNETPRGKAVTHKNKQVNTGISGGHPGAQP